MSYSTTGGSANIMIGGVSGYYNNDSSYNTFVGYGTGRGTGIYNGDRNTLIGGLSGYKLGDGSDDNIFIGYRSGSTLLNS